MNTQSALTDEISFSNAASAVLLEQNGDTKQSVGIPVFPVSGGSDSSALGDFAIWFNGK